MMSLWDVPDTSSDVLADDTRRSRISIVSVSRC